MNIKLIKKILMILFILSITFMIFTNTYATDDVISGGDGFVKLGKNETSPIREKNLQNASNTVYNILLVAGVVIAVCVAAILGIQFMTGSMEAQAKVKESLIPFVVGCIIVFGAFGIWKLAVNIGQDKIDTSYILDKNISLAKGYTKTYPLV